LFRRKFVDIRDRFRAEPVTAARLYIDIEEGELAPHLDAVVAAHPAVRIGSYPRFSERDFRVLVTLEAADAHEVGAAFEQLAAALGARVVRREDPHRVGAP
jgi:molybdopterin-biosynthesis enzyme MoeA-like protein